MDALHKILGVAAQPPNDADGNAQGGWDRDVSSSCDEQKASCNNQAGKPCRKPNDRSADIASAKVCAR